MRYRVTEGGLGPNTTAQIISASSLGDVTFDLRADWDWERGWCPGKFELLRVERYGPYNFRMFVIFILNCLSKTSVIQIMESPGILLWHFQDWN